MPEAISASGYENLPAGIDVIESQLYYPDGFHRHHQQWLASSQVLPFSWNTPAMAFVVCDGGTVSIPSTGREPALYHADGEVEQLPSPPPTAIRPKSNTSSIARPRSRNRPDYCSPRIPPPPVA
ncbi:MAG: hypothetical protein U0R19_06860 [Bryobacteraceae bacterium]